MGMETSISVSTAITGGHEKTYTLGSVLYEYFLNNFFLKTVIILKAIYDLFVKDY